MARLPILLPLKLVVGGGVEPPMFTTWVAVLQTALFGHLEKPYNKLVGVDGIEPSYAGVSDQCVNHFAILQLKFGVGRGTRTHNRGIMIP